MHRLSRCLGLLGTFAFAMWQDACRAQSVTFGGVTYVNSGLQGVGRVDNALRDKLSETFGSLSGMAVDPVSWRRASDGTFSGTLYTQPDRGYTKSGATTNYRPRRHKFSFTFKPSPAGSSQQSQVALTLSDSMLLTETNGVSLTGLDPTASGSGTRTGFPALPQAYNGGISLDAEGLAILPDGSFFVSDEYGPYIYRFGADGIWLSAIRPPEALIPKRNNADSFSSDSPAAGQPNASPSQPTTGRANNKGFEGLSLSADGHTLFALMQAATRQDTGGGFNRFARMLRYDVTNPASPTLTGEWVLPLPLYTDSGTQQNAEAHELVALSATRFLVLAHDGNGRGSSTTKSIYRAVLVYDISSATNIAGQTTDSLSVPLAQNGVLANNITPATSAVIVDINDSTQLAKFNLNNSSNDDSNTLSDSWESLALVPVLDATAPDDFYLLIGNDNNYSTNNGFIFGGTFSASPNIDTMVLAYRVTLPGTLTVPSIITAPVNSTVSAGAAATFTVAASGNPAVTFQWSKNGSAISGATSATLTIPNAQAADAGSYTVTVTNANGAVTSSAASLTVTGANSPVISAQPVAQTIAVGSTVVFSVTATNSPNYQWQFNGSAISGATTRFLVLNAAAAANAGSYSVVVSNSSGAATSSSVALSVVTAAPADTGHLINLSILTPLAISEKMTMGTVLGGGGTSGTKSLLARAAGPSLQQFGITSFLPDPTMTLNYTTSSPVVVVATNNDWGGATTMSNAFASVGAFPYSSATSLDAALFQNGTTALQTGNYTVEVRDAGSGRGTVIAELYDATATSAFTAATPRLINVSVLKDISTGSSLTAGFVIGGSTAKTVLIRAIGPTLATTFNIGTAMPDPQLTLNNTSVSPSVVVATNNDWAGETALSQTGTRVGAFAVSNTASKDAMLLVTLAPGQYTAQVGPASGTAGGTAIVEVYEVP